MNIDHVVLWVENSEQALDFYVDVLGLDAVRRDEFRAGAAMFPSVRINDGTILDLMAREIAPKVSKFTRGGEGAGTAINHLCLSVSTVDYATIAKKLDARGIDFVPGGDGPFGARGNAAESGYFHDRDGNVIEIRHYGEAEDTPL